VYIACFRHGNISFDKGAFAACATVKGEEIRYAPLHGVAVDLIADLTKGGQTSRRHSINHAAAFVRQ
jgi:hypothetical protein